jgi:hypothetical protein
MMTSSGIVTSVGAMVTMGECGCCVSGSRDCGSVYTGAAASSASFHAGEHAWACSNSALCAANHVDCW